MNQDNKGFIKNFKLSEAFWTGLFVFAAAILLWLGYSYISGSSSEEGFNIKVKFENVYGLEKGNEIIFSGLVIGQVDNVGTLGGAKSGGLNPIVTLKIEERYSDMLYDDTQFSIKSPLLLGEYWIEASRPEGSTTKNKNKLRRGQVVEGFSELSASDFASGIQDQASTILYNVNKFSEVLYELVEDGQIKNDIKDSFQNLSMTLEEIRALLGNFKAADSTVVDISKIKKSIDNLYASSEEIPLIIGDVREVVGKLGATITNINEITGKINSGKGTLGKLLNNDDLYEKYASIADNANSFINNANGLIDDIENNPKKYINWIDIIKGWRGKE